MYSGACISKSTPDAGKSGGGGIASQEKQDFRRHHGCCCVQGPQGPKGATGAVGPQGIPGPVVSNVANITSETSGAVPILSGTINLGDLGFSSDNTNYSITGTQIIFNCSTPTRYLITARFLYQITSALLSGSSFQIYKNGAPLPSSLLITNNNQPINTYGSFTFPQVIVDANQNDYIAFVWLFSSGSAAIYPENSSIIIQQIPSTTACLS